MSANPRAQAARVLTQVLVGRHSLTQALPRALASLPPAESGRSLVQELCYGVLRWHPRLAALAQALLPRPLRRRDADLYSLLLVGLYQLAHLNIPAHAAVDETVTAAGSLGRAWGAGLVNGVLRSYARNRDALTAQVECREPARFAHPQWIVDGVRAAWPDHWQQVLEANNARPPMHLRVNTSRISRADYLELARDGGLAVLPVPQVPSGVVLDAPREVARLPGFADGLVSVQDGAAQLAVPMLELAAGHRVLDACAAPGGKTAHIAESEPALARLVALERDPTRAARLTDNLRRLRLKAETHIADATQTGTWWDGNPFDRILLDAPCSATGVIRRHPDIKCLRRAGDIAALSAAQDALLEALWPLLDSGGMLLYATCSVLPQENAQRMAAFLDRHPEATPRQIRLPVGRPCSIGHQVLPGEGGMDGFYYAGLVKR